jgi:hypothetical protein
MLNSPEWECASSPGATAVSPSVFVDMGDSSSK